MQIMGMELLGEIIAEIRTLHATDGLTILTLAALEGILSVDNSLVLAILVRALPEHQRKKALTYGIVGAFVFRFLALIFATYMMRFVIFKLVGGAYLVYLAMKHMFFFFREETHQFGPRRAHAGFWKTVAAVELTDIAFSIDSITAAVAMSNKIVIVWTGGILGIIFLRFMAGILVRLLEKFPRLEDLAYQLIFFIGTKLLLDAFHVKIEHGIFWAMMGVIIILGTALVYKDYYQRKTRNQFHDLLVERLEAGEIEVRELLELEYIPREVIDYLVRKECLTIRLPNERGACRIAER